MYVNTETEESTALGTAARPRPVKTQQLREDLVRAGVNCRVYELAIALH
jgi:hypothetical protein